MIPWQSSSVDVRGLQTLKDNNDVNYEFMCDTMADPVMKMLEIEKNAANVDRNNTIDKVFDSTSAR